MAAGAGPPVPEGPLREVAAVFLRLGAIAFGGPAAHIAMMRDEVVRRRQWLTEEEFLDLLGATNLIPGPNSTEMAIHLGYRRARWPGLLVAGACFILPAALIVLALAWAYVQFGTTPQAGSVLYGVKPVVIAIILQALWSLGRAAVRTPLLAAIGLGVLSLYLAGVGEIALLFGTGFLVMALAAVGPLRRLLAVLAAVLVLAAPALGRAAAAAADVPVSLRKLFLIFLKIGSVLYGSGYVLLAFLRRDFVEGLGWLSDRQLLDAVAVGQFTPGPVFTTATFVGYIVGSWPGALLATLGIFLPSFIFVAASHPFVARLRRSRLAGGFLDGVNVAALALMAGVTWQLGRAAITDSLTAALAVVAAALLFRTRLNVTWLLLGGAVAGALAHL